MTEEIPGAAATSLLLIPVPAVYDSRVQYGETSEGGTYRMALDFPCGSDKPFRVYVHYTSHDGGGTVSVHRTACGRFLATDELGGWYVGDDAAELLPWPVHEGWQTSSEPPVRVGDSSHKSTS